MSSAGLQEYWDHLNSLDKDVRTIVLKYWDETGRPTTGHPFAEAVGDMLDLSTTFDDFCNKYLQLVQESDEMHKVADAQMYYHVYVAGMKRVGKFETVDG